MDEPKPKRKYVMTPEHKARVVASLEKARLVPKEIRYRRTEKRYQANLNNLGIAAAKRREKAAQELQDVRAQMESTFPPGEPGFGIRAPGSSPNPESRLFCESPGPESRVPARQSWSRQHVWWTGACAWCGAGGGARGGASCRC